MKTTRKLLSLLAAVCVLFAGLPFTASAADTVTITSVATVIAPPPGKTSRISFTATLNGDTTGFAKTVAGYTADSIWFDDAYMYLTNAVSGAGAVTVTCAKDGASEAKVITVIPYAAETFDSYATGTLSSALVPNSSAYSWEVTATTGGLASVGERAGDPSNKYLKNSSTGKYGARLLFAQAVDSAMRDVTVEFELSKVSGTSSRTGFLFKGGSKTDYFLYCDIDNNTTGDYDIYLGYDVNGVAGTTNTPLLAEGLSFGAFTKVKFLMNYATKKYAVYINGVKKAEDYTIPVSTYANYLIMAEPIDNLAVYSGEEVPPVLTYVINDDYSAWPQGTKYYNGGSAAWPSGLKVNQVVVNAGDSTNAYFEPAAFDGKSVLRSYYNYPASTNSENVRYTGAGIGGKFLVEYNINIAQTGTNVGVTGDGVSYDDQGNETPYFPTLFKFGTDGYFYVHAETQGVKYKTNEWNTVQVLSDTADGSYTVYLNGRPVAQNTLDQMKNFVFTTIRHNVFLRNSTGLGESCLDYFKVANVAAQGFDFSQYSTEFTYDGLRVAGEEIFVDGGAVDAADIVAAIEAGGKSASVCDEQGDAVQSGALADGYSLYVSSKNHVNTCHYAVYVDNGDSSVSLSADFSRGKAGVFAKISAEADAWLMVCFYEAPEKLVGVKLFESPYDALPLRTLDKTANIPENALSVKAMLWESGTLKPLDEAKPLERPVELPLNNGFETGGLTG